MLVYLVKGITFAIPKNDMNNNNPQPLYFVSIKYRTWKTPMNCSTSEFQKYTSGYIITTNQGHEIELGSIASRMWNAKCIFTLKEKKYIYGPQTQQRLEFINQRLNADFWASLGL